MKRFNRLWFVRVWFMVLLVFLVTSLWACQKKVDEEDLSLERPSTLSQPFDEVHAEKIAQGDIEFDEKTLLIKVSIEAYQDYLNGNLFLDNRFGIEDLELILALNTPVAYEANLYEEAVWVKARLRGHNAQSIIRDVRKNEAVLEVDLNYYHQTSANGSYHEVEGNSLLDEQWYLANTRVWEAWEYLTDEEKPAGGLPEVVIAVIDTGVDYTHEDLRDSMWRSPEGHFGINVVGDSRFHTNDPMDDHGHGTHVAGIIAAQNNNLGIVGVAYNTKIMAIKAGNASGFFLQSDIAEAILYAFEHGADVINMSFGGATHSTVVYNALAIAYTRSVLVASAGNSGLPNQNCPIGFPIYPAAYPFVVGVMSTGRHNSQSLFSNWDCIPYNNLEYDVYAPGENIISTLPGDRYAKWSGTSMAAPIVSAIAGLVRSQHLDREVYPNKYIMGQLIATNEMMLGAHGIVDAYNALTTAPQPMIKYYHHYLFDSESISLENNGDGVIDAGETIHLGLELRNRWGVSESTTVTFDALSSAGIPNPYIEWVVDTVDFGPIGTMSIKDNGKILQQNEVIGVEHPIVFKIDSDTPNDMLFTLNGTISYSDENDVFEETFTVHIEVRNGQVLPSIISEDMTLTNDTYWIIPDATLIREGVTVIVEEGTQIQFGDVKSDDYYKTISRPRIIVDGNLIIQGTPETQIDMFPSELRNYAVDISQRNNGYIILEHVRVVNPVLNVTEIKNSRFTQNSSIIFDYLTSNGIIASTNRNSVIYADFVYNSYFDNLGEEGNPLLMGAQSLIGSSLSNMYVKLFLGTQSLTYYLPGEHYIFIRRHVSQIAPVIENNLFLNMTIEDPFGNVIDSKIMFSNLDVVANNNSFLFNSHLFAPFSWMKLASYGYFSVHNPGWPHLSINNDTDFSNYYTELGSVYFGAASSRLTDLILLDMNRNFYASTFKYSLKDDNDFEATPPFVRNVEVRDSFGELTSNVGNEPIEFTVHFSRDMDTEEPFIFRFGSSKPYGEYVVEGDFVDERTWVGNFTFNTIIENGTQFINMHGGRALDAPWLTLPVDIGRFVFNIDTSEALAMMLQANPSSEGIELTWLQDDYDTLAGYHVYRSRDEHGLFERINDQLIPLNQNTFVDTNIEPGEVYFYNFTVVMTDFTESEASSKVRVQALDTMPPNIYHTPITHAFNNQNILIRATIIDNVQITEAKLFYRALGENEWRSVNMLANNDVYTAIIPASQLDLLGMEYYISASDGRNVITKGSEFSPLNILIQEALSLDSLGDVNGDGVINVLDALMVLQAMHGKINLTAEQFARADLNGNGVLEIHEALRILQYATGRVGSLQID